MPSARLRLYLFRTFRLETGAGELLRLPVGKGQALFAYLAMHGGERRSRGELAALLWDRSDERDARNNLSQCLFRVRRALGAYAHVLCADSAAVWVDGDRLDVDAVEFERLSDAPHAVDLLDAAAMFGGPVLADLAVAEPAFDDWRTARSAALAQIHEGVLRRLCARSLTKEETEKAVQIAQWALGFDQLNEAAHRLVIRAYADLGQKKAALRQYEACRRTLRTELGVEPEITTTSAAIEAAQGPADSTGVETGFRAAGAPATPAEPPSIAVLPFTDQTEFESQAYFAEGVAEDVIALLSKHRWLRVVARGSSFGYRGERRDPILAARQLGVRYVLDGSARRSGMALRMSMRLLEGESGDVLWAEQYEQPLDALFVIESAVSRAAAAEIERAVTASELLQARRKAPADLDAWDVYQLGVWRHMRFRKDDSVRARRLFHEAIEREPDFAQAYARLAHAEVSAALLGFPQMNYHELGDSLAVANRSVALDDEDPMCRYALGRVRSRRREHDLAIDELDRAIELNPSFAVAHFGRAQAAIACGRIDEVLPSIKMAVDLSPRDPGMWTFLSVGARALICQERYEEAALWARRAFELPRTEIARSGFALVSALGHLNRLDEARAAIERIQRVRPEFSVTSIAAGPLAHFDTEDHRERILTGLRKANLEN